jgi:hypothetical protein
MKFAHGICRKEDTLRKVYSSFSALLVGTTTAQHQTFAHRVTPQRNGRQLAPLHHMC